MSRIFSTETRTTPRPDATIRIRHYIMPPEANGPADEYRSAQLLEFHPDYDTRMKFRGVAYLRPEPWMEHPAYVRCGVGYLPDEQVYVEVREFMVHEDDRQELYRYCAGLPWGKKAVIIHPCPLPFPMFKKRDRVVVVGKDERGGEEALGKLATVMEASSQGNMTTIRFDEELLNRGFKSLGFTSSNLRKVEE